MSVLYFFAEHRNSFLTFLQEIGKNCGSETVLIVLLSLLLWCGGKKLAYRIGFTFYYSSMLIQGLKITVRMPRPWVLDPKFKVLEEAVPSATGYSFPSGHSQTAASIYGAILLNLKKWWGKVLLLCLILLVGFSRMYAGVHTPLDVSVGIGATLVVAVILHLIFQKKDNAESTYTSLAIVLIVLAVLLFIYDCVMLYGVKLIDLNNAADLAKSAGSAIGFSVGYMIEQKKIQFSEKRPKLLFGILRVAAGIGSLLLVRAGLKALLSPLEITGDFLRYLLMTFWMVAIYPCLFLAWEKKLAAGKQ